MKEKMLEAIIDAYKASPVEPEITYSFLGIFLGTIVAFVFDHWSSKTWVGKAPATGFFTSFGSFFSAIFLFGVVKDFLPVVGSLLLFHPLHLFLLLVPSLVVWFFCLISWWEKRDRRR